MTESERQQYLPAIRTFTDILQQDNLSVDQMNVLLQQARELTEGLKQSANENNGAGLGGLGGFGQLGKTSVGGTKYNDFLLPENADHIVNVPGQGPSFNTAIGKNMFEKP